MSTTPFWLAAIATPELLSKAPYATSSAQQWVLILGAIGLVTLLAVGWVILTQKRRSRHHHHHHHHHHSAHHHEPSESKPLSGDDGTTASQGAVADGSDGAHHHRRRRRRRRDHRPRNPTLAETGGLPPIRTEGPPGLP